MRRSPTETKLLGMIRKICKILLLDLQACTQKVCTTTALRVQLHSVAFASFQNVRGLNRGSIGKELSQ